MNSTALVVGLDRGQQQGLGLGIAHSQPLHHAREHAALAPALPPVVQRLMRTIGTGRISPAQSIALDEDDAAEHPPVIHSRPAVALGKNGRIRSICSSVSQKRSLIPVSSQSLNQIATLTSMGPEPNSPQKKSTDVPVFAGTTVPGR